MAAGRDYQPALSDLGESTNRVNVRHTACKEKICRRPFSVGSVDQGKDGSGGVKARGRVGITKKAPKGSKSYGVLV